MTETNGTATWPQEELARNVLAGPVSVMSAESDPTDWVIGEI